MRNKIIVLRSLASMGTQYAKERFKRYCYRRELYIKRTVNGKKVLLKYNLDYEDIPLFIK